MITEIQMTRIRGLIHQKCAYDFAGKANLDMYIPWFLSYVLDGKPGAKFLDDLTKQEADKVIDILVNDNFKQRIVKVNESFILQQAGQANFRLMKAAAKKYGLNLNYRICK